MMLRPGKSLEPNGTNGNPISSVFMSVQDQNRAPTSVYSSNAYAQIHKRPGLMKPTRSQITATPEASKQSSPSRGVRFSDFKTSHASLNLNKRTGEGWLPQSRKNFASVEINPDRDIDHKAFTSEYMLQNAQKNWRE